MSRWALWLSAGLLVCGLSAPALANQPYDYPPPYSAAHPSAYLRYAYPWRHPYAYRYRHDASSPYHRHSGLEPYSYYYPEK
jgi:hypothetical protein